jgi:hypothetical protein
MSRRVVGHAKPCHFFQQGRCTNPNCGFRHVPPALVQLDPDASGSNATAELRIAADARRVVACPGGGAPSAPRAPGVCGSEAGGGAGGDASVLIPAPTPRCRAASLAPIVAVAGIDVATAAMAHIAGRQVLQHRGPAHGPARDEMAAGEPGPCCFFTRTGACDRGAACKYAHDPDRVAVCRAFLAKKCDAAEGAGRGRTPGAGVCLLSHELSAERTPVCSFFLRGLCADAQCVYAHVAVSRAAPPCADFAYGYCARGLACKEQHLLACDEWATRAMCPRGDECPLRHTHRSQAVGGVAKRARLSVSAAAVPSESPPPAMPATGAEGA